MAMFNPRLGPKDMLVVYERRPCESMRTSFDLPCVLQSAYKLRCGLLAYARATATSNEVKLASFDETGRTDGLLQFIEQKCSDLCPALSACNDSARMVIQIDRALEDFVLRRSWKNDMQQWLVGLNCEQ